MERAGPDTQPLPVVETVAAPVIPAADTAAPPVEPEGPPPPVPARGGRDLTPLVLGLLAVAAVLAIGLSVLALSRRDQPGTPLDPTGADTTATTVPTSSPPTSVDPPPATSGSVVTTTPAPNATTSRTTARSGSDGDGRGKRGGRGKD